MLPAQAVNVAEAAMPRPPPPCVFLEFLKKAMEAPKVPTADVQLFGDIFPEVRQPPGTEKNQKGAYAAITNFQKVMVNQNVVIENLDDYMVAFAKWTLSMESLFDDDSQKVAAKAQRAVLCQAAGVPMYQWSPDTLTTYSNALGLLYKQARPPIIIIMKASAQFPKFVRFLDAARSRLKKKRARAPQTKVLDDDDILVLHGKTVWGSWFEAQRMNIVVLAYGLGQRRESLQELCVGNFHVQHMPNGGKSARFCTHSQSWPNGSRPYQN